MTGYAQTRFTVTVLTVKGIGWQVRCASFDRLRMREAFVVLRFSSW